MTPARERRKCTCTVVASCATRDAAASRALCVACGPSSGSSGSSARGLLHVTATELSSPTARASMSRHAATAARSSAASSSSWHAASAAPKETACVASLDPPPRVSSQSSSAASTRSSESFAFSAMRLMSATVPGSAPNNTQCDGLRSQSPARAPRIAARIDVTPASDEAGAAAVRGAASARANPRSSGCSTVCRMLTSSPPLLPARNSTTRGSSLRPRPSARMDCTTTAAASTTGTDVSTSMHRSSKGVRGPC
mmetsp:Transcript_5891/g.14602  ORF Transcript_5891/g.14602 Transcript_5891/m.14602 type:complete len:254 (-) Transcript_5891:2931-3692(-)